MTDITVYRKNTKTIELTFTDDAGVAIDITGWTIFFTVKAKKDFDADDSTALIKKNVTVHDSPLTGYTTVPLSATDTNIGAQTYVYDVKVLTDDNAVITITEGNFILIDNVANRNTAV